MDLGLAPEPSELAEPPRHGHRVREDMQAAALLQGQQQGSHLSTSRAGHVAMEVGEPSPVLADGLAVGPIPGLSMPK
eukprot:11942983-Alexandrium_andersonii.AAC.1